MASSSTPEESWKDPVVERKPPLLASAKEDKRASRRVKAHANRLMLLVPFKGG